MSRRTLRVLGLVLITAVLGSAFVGNADARTHKLSKAQKTAIRKQLRKAVKKNPRVITRRWFLKKASLVSFSLPSTIRLDPVTDQNGSHGVQNFATLDLGPSLGTHKIALSGNLHANINFNDAFDGGSLGDVRITLPPDPSASLSTTAVPLLTNPDTAGAGAPAAPQDEINGFVIAPNPSALPSILGGGGPNTYTLPVGTTPDPVSLTLNADWVTCATYSYTAYQTNNGLTPSVGQACQNYANYLRDNIATAPSVGGARNIYVAAVPASVAAKANGNTAVAVHTLFAGQRNEQSVGGFGQGLTNVGPGLYLMNAGSILLKKPYSSGTSTIQVPAQAHGEDVNGYGGCGSWDGNGAPLGNATQDVDLPSHITQTDDPGNDNAIGNYAPSLDSSAGPEDVVLRTGALQLNVAAPTKVTVPGDNTDNPGSALASDFTAGDPGIFVPVDDLPAFVVGQNITVTDGFNSDTGHISAINDTTGELTIDTGTLTTTTDSYPTGSIVGVEGDATADKNVGTSGGRANLFGQPVNGLAKGNSVDVTVNLATDIHSIARQVDAATPPPFGGPSVETQINNGAGYTTGATSIVVDSTTGIVPGEITIVGTGGTQRARVTSVTNATTLAVTGLSGAVADNALVSQTAETGGNINAYSDCRQAWTGSVRNYLTGIKLVGSLRISPALTADGKVRIAKVNLRTPQAIPESLAACLTPYQLYMQGVNLAGDPFFPETAPQLIFGAVFNPLVVLAGSSEGVSPKPNAKCNASGGPLARSPFNSYPHAGGATDLKSILSSGAAVGVSGTLKTAIKAEVIVGQD
jgi:hypothetical protein